MADKKNGKLTGFLNALADHKTGTRQDWDAGNRNKAIDEYKDAGGLLNEKKNGILKAAAANQNDPDLTQVQAEANAETPPANTYLWVK